MRLQSMLLLAAAAILICVNVTATTDLKTTQARSFTGTGGDVAAQRLLRASANADEDNGEERALIFDFSKLKAWIKPDTAAKISTKASTTKVASKIAVMDDQVDDVLKGLSLKEAFKKMELEDLINNPKLLNSRKFKLWLGHMTETNRNNKGEATTVTKFLTSKHGDDNVAKMLEQARRSDIPAVKDMGFSLQLDQFKHLIKAKQSPDEVAVLIPSLSTDMMGLYKKMWLKAVSNSKKASEMAKTKLRANEAANALLRRV